MQRTLGAHRFGAGQLGQPLHPALRLLGLARLGLEAVDERLQVRALRLFLLVGDLLLAQVLGALAFEIGVVADVQLGLALVQVQGVGGDVVEELAVVRDHQQGAVVALQPFLHPHHGIEVEVVGRLVEQQQVAGRHQRARHVQAHPPAAGEVRDRGFVRRGGEPETVQQPAGTRGTVVTVHFLQPMVGLRNRFPVLVGEGVGLHLDGGVHGFVAGQHEVDGRVRQVRGFLRHRGDARLRREIEVTLVGLDLAHQRGEQGRLAGAIAADHADPPPGMQGQVDIGQEKAFAPAQGEIAERDHPTIVSGRGA